MTQVPPAEAFTEGPPVIGARLQLLRQARKLSLDELSRRAGVSKSMLSQVERNLANPTVAVLWRLANALGIGLAEFLSGGQADKPTPTVTVIPAHSIPVIRSPDGKCELKILGPVDLASRVEWYELSIHPGGVLASEPHESGSKEHLSVMSGCVTVQSGPSEKKVRHGESARYPADVQHAISNPGKAMATALLVVEYAQ
ncbi:XRE family transcriptional regulator [Cupriavidus sp. CV2]|uniref:helix-turn-helix domain-containing protein n=1 Tax=Cupriavidus ulmosensis TaxID=3065913 RepID=UPI00296AC14D|nr:XRE family transcriptional regulator [Cupriavidus sp. CV2]MDW3683686.1 XRE family transcriptional regulator [Cupriavidus sp. CV2]